MFAVVSVEIVVTYSRLPPRETFNVSRTGIAGGASRVVTFWNWPLALVAIAILAFLAERLSRRSTTIVAIAGVLLCCGIFWPGIVKQSNLDAKAANAVPALGALVALALTFVAAHLLDRPARWQWQPWDGLRIALAGVALALAVPWLVADLGFTFEGVPVLSSIYRSGELSSEPGRIGLHPAVHAGHHHGMTGVLLLLSALLLSRVVPSVQRRGLRGLLAAYVALMFCYGAAVLANDVWLEQVVKRGWTDWSIPSAINPTASVIWALVLVVTLVLVVATAWLRRRPSSRMS